VETKPRKGKKTKTYIYCFVNDVPLRDGDDALQVNWCELTILNEAGDVFVIETPGGGGYGDLNIDA